VLVLRQAGASPNQEEDVKSAGGAYRQYENVASVARRAIYSHYELLTPTAADGPPTTTFPFMVFRSVLNSLFYPILG
jgi:hypothetical protein